MFYEYETRMMFVHKQKHNQKTVLFYVQFSNVKKIKKNRKNLEKKSENLTRPGHSETGQLLTF